MPFFPAAPGEFSPLWRMLDDYATHRTSPCEAKQHAKSKSTCNPAVNAFYQPRFDVKEYPDRFELDGELPGVTQSDIDIEFTDPQTLKISGRSARQTDDPKPAAGAAPAIEAPASEPTAQSQSHSATVEDEPMTNADTDANAEASEADWTPVPTPTPTSTPGPDAAAAGAVTAAVSADASGARQNSTSKSPKPRYWLSERAVGRFQRTFTFPGDRVDAESVKASLREGILRVVVPKAPEPAKVKISVQ